MARFDVEFTKTYEEHDGTFLPIDRTRETVERGKRDTHVLLMVIGCIAVIFIIFMAGMFAMLMKQTSKQATNLQSQINVLAQNDLVHQQSVTNLVEWDKFLLAEIQKRKLICAKGW